MIKAFGIVVMLGLAACAEGLGAAGGAGGTGDGDGGAAQTTGSGKTTGTGATGATSGTAGSTSATSSASSSSASSFNASSSASTTGGGPSMDSTVLYLVGGASSLIGSRYNVVTQDSYTYPFAGSATIEPLALVVLQSGLAVGAIREWTDDKLHFGTFGTNWSLFTPVDADLVIAGPARLAASGNQAHAVYAKAGGAYSYALYDAVQWTVIDEAVGSPASAGPTRPAIAAIGANPVVLFVADDGDLCDRTRAGAWGTEHAHGLPFDAAPIAPALVAPPSGPELVAVFVAEADGQMHEVTRTGGTWSAPAPVTGALTAVLPELAVLDSGEILLAFRGLDSLPYTASKIGGSWSAPAAVSPTSPTVACAPAVTRGAGGAEAELAITDNTGLMHTSRRTSTGWAPLAFWTIGGKPSCNAVAVVP